MNTERYCPKCGQENSKEARFCSKCGYKFETPKDGKTQMESSNISSLMDRTKDTHRTIAIVVSCLLLAILAVGVSSSLIYQSKERAHQQYLENSEARVKNERKVKESKQESLESALAYNAKSVVTDMVQNDQNIDAKCKSVTITSHDYGNQYSGYARLEDDEGTSDTVDITITNVKYNDTVSVQMDSDQVDNIADTFSSNN